MGHNTSAPRANSLVDAVPPPITIQNAVSSSILHQADDSKESRRKNTMLNQKTTEHSTASLESQYHASRYCSPSSPPPTIQSINSTIVAADPIHEAKSHERRERGRAISASSNSNRSRTRMVTTNKGFHARNLLSLFFRWELVGDFQTWVFRAHFSRSLKS